MRASPSAKSRYASDSEHGLEDRPRPAARQHGYGRGGAAGTAKRPGRPRALPLHAIAARPLHGAEPTGEAAVALGLRRAPIVARQGALPAKPELLSGMPGGPASAACISPIIYRTGGKSRPSYASRAAVASVARRPLTPPASSAGRPAPPPLRQAP